jgi:protocatechuate 3,4-dioxygenase beta subunit
MSPDLTRRRLLGAAGAAGLALVAGCGGDDEPTATNSPEPTPTPTATPSGGSGAAALLDEANSCAVAPETTEGPFYFDPESVRSDIREDRDGVALRLALRVQQGESCTPLKDAVVSIWHCDALGVYSGYGEADGERFLRGEQVTDGDGVVEFVTVYPGWYQGRAVHAHLKVFLDGSTAVTTQLFFDEEFTDSVFAEEPYRSTGERDVRIEGDGVYSQADAEGTPLLLTLKRDGDDVLAAGNIVVAA